MKTTGLTSILLLAFAVGCGGDSGGSYGDPIPNAQAEMAGTASVDGASDLTVLGAEPDNENAVGQTFAVYGSLSQMASIKQSQVPTSQRRTGDTHGVWDPGCVASSGGTTTYTACDSGGATIDGTITGSATSVDMDLTLTTDQVAIDMTGGLDFSATSISGNLKYDTSLEASGMNITTTYDGDYDVTLDGQGCPVGGQVEVHYTVSGGAIDVFAKAEFGPACGAVTFF